MTWLSETASSFEAPPKQDGCIAVTTFETISAFPVARVFQQSFLLVA